jgi:hypothetical protein
MTYHQGTGLPIITTVTGMESFTRFCASLSLLSSQTASNSETPLIAPISFKQNLSPQQRIKLLLHKHCTHKNMKTINQWIQHGYFNVNPVIASAPDPICVACQYGEAHIKLHKNDKASITEKHNSPGAGVSADQLEAGYP